MSLRWMNAVFAAPEPSGTDRLLLLALADNANDEGVCWPGVETIRQKCGLGTRRAAEKALRRVAEWSERVAGDPSAPAGCVLLRVEERAGRSSVYRLELSGGVPPAVPPPEPQDGGEPGDGSELRDGSERQDGTEPQDGGTPERQDGPTPELQDGPTPERWDGGGPSPRTGEPSKNPHVNPQQHASHARGRVQRLGDALPRASGERVADAAADFLKGSEGDAGAISDRLLRALTRRGVDRPVALRLVRRYPERVGPAVARFDSEGGGGSPKGPGWLVAAIRDDYAAGGGGRGGPLLSYAEMLAACDRQGVTTDAFEPVPQLNGQKPLWRRKPKGVAHEPVGVR